jgi:hypothetical protein
LTYGLTGKGKIMTNKFKRHGLKAALAVAALFAAQAVSAAPIVLDGDQIKITKGPLQYGDGGEFLATTGSSGSFISFCLEVTQDVYWGSTYTAALNTGAVKGGAGFLDNSGAGIDGNASFDPLSNATAWLYKTYMTDKSSLSGYANTPLFAGAVQSAIWFLEDERPLNFNPSTQSAATDLANQAIAAVAGPSGWTNPGDVYVLNLTTPAYWVPATPLRDSYRVAEVDNQDILYYANPVPEPETYAMMLAGLGLMGFVARRRKQNTAA